MERPLCETARVLVALQAAALSGCSFDPAAVGSSFDGGRPDPDAAVTTADPDASPPPPGTPFCDAQDVDLAACWTFELSDEPNRLDDGSAYGNHGSVKNADHTVGVAGLALSITDETIIYVPDSESLDAEDAVTIEGWLKLTSMPTDQRGWMVDNQGQYGLAITAQGEVRCTGGGGNALSIVTLTQEIWTHVACVFDGDEGAQTVYVNGSPSGSDAQDSMLAVAPNDGLVLGGDSPCSQAPCNELLVSTLDQVRIWRRARTAAEICTAAGRASCD
jgi:hypothetical protein